MSTQDETPPAEPAPQNNLFACPTCNGWHFNISRGGTLVCTSRGNVGTVGCGWRGSLEQPPRQEGEGLVIHQITCVHHTDAERAAITCPVCLAAKVKTEFDIGTGYHAKWQAAERRAADAEAEVKRLTEGIATIRSATQTSDGTRLMNVGGMLIQNLCDQILP